MRKGGLHLLVAVNCLSAEPEGFVEFEGLVIRFHQKFYRFKTNRLKF